MSDSQPLQQFHASTPMRIAALWTSTMFCYVYGDLIGFYLPGRIEATAAGDFGPLGQVTPFLLTATAAALALPAIMISLSLLLPARISRIANMTVGALYTAMIGISAIPAPTFYQLLGVIEMTCTVTIFWLALKWPQGG